MKEQSDNETAAVYGCVTIDTQSTRIAEIYKAAINSILNSERNTQFDYASGFNILSNDILPEETIEILSRVGDMFLQIQLVYASCYLDILKDNGVVNLGLYFDSNQDLSYFSNVYKERHRISFIADCVNGIYVRRDRPSRMKGHSKSLIHLENGLIIPSRKAS